jgi:hypothetical protein
MLSTLNVFSSSWCSHKDCKGHIGQFVCNIELKYVDNFFILNVMYLKKIVQIKGKGIYSNPYQ